MKAVQVNNRSRGRLRAPMVPRLFQVVRVIQESHDTTTLVLRRDDGGKTDPFLPGQFNMIGVLGLGEVPISYSGNPFNTREYFHTIRAVGAVTQHLCALKKGAQVGIRGPFGTHWPIQESKGKDVLIITGGIGLAPLRPVVYSLGRWRDQYAKVTLLYGARTPDDVLYSKEFKKWRDRWDIDVQITVDRAMGKWKGEVGVVTDLIGRSHFDPDNTVAMVCGPELMMRFTMGRLYKAGVSEENIFVSMERNMECGIGFCGHCQLGPFFICKDGAVFRFDQIRPWFSIQEL